MGSRARTLRIATLRYMGQWLARSTFKAESIRADKSHEEKQDDIGRIEQQILYVLIKYNRGRNKHQTHSVTQRTNPTNKNKYIPTSTGRLLPPTTNQDIPMQPDRHIHHIWGSASSTQRKSSPNATTHHIRTPRIWKRLPMGDIYNASDRRVSHPTPLPSGRL